MKHQINMIVENKNVDRKLVELNANEEAMHNSSSDLSGKIEWREDLIFDSCNQAEKFIKEESRKKSHLQMAVLFKDLKMTKALENKKDQIVKTFMEWENLKKKDYFKNIKSETIVCPHCKSKVNVDYVKFNECPVCGTNLRSKSVEDRIKNKRIELDKLYDELEEIQKDPNNQELKWLIKYEYHV